jgi:hypothetical protein
MRTTLSIDDELLGRARDRARAEGVTLGKVVEDALRRALSRPVDTPPAQPLPVFAGGSGPRLGIDLESNRALHEALDEGLTLDRLR